jgi:ubiquitin-conjugating enzyme E2 variant
VVVKSKLSMIEEMEKGKKGVGDGNIRWGIENDDEMKMKNWNGMIIGKNRNNYEKRM